MKKEWTKPSARKTITQIGIGGGVYLFTCYFCGEYAIWALVVGVILFLISLRFN